MKMRTQAIILSFIGIHCAYSQNIYIPTLDNVPAGYNINHKFRLSKNYPNSLEGYYPWKSINFKDASQTERYIRTVLAYFLEGNVTTRDFQINRATAKRKWYHAPAMHFDKGSGREFFMGLTRERDSKSQELSDKQIGKRQNWAIGFYNDIGAQTIKKVWRDPSNPLNTSIQFDEGSVAAKLLFTHDPNNNLDYLKNTMIWRANIHTSVNHRNARTPKDVKLIQLDLAVKDKRSPLGWVFGTFVYHKSHDSLATNWYEHLLCIGASWGMDRRFQWINPKFREFRAKFNNGSTWQLGMVEGVANTKNTLLNGPIDNPESSCIGCHKKAGNPHNSGNMDYSLQLDYGIDDKLGKHPQKRNENFSFKKNTNQLPDNDIRLTRLMLVSLLSICLCSLFSFFFKK